MLFCFVNITVSFCTMPNTPPLSQRTRSGSNTQQTITLHDFKTLLDGLKSDLTCEINKVNDKIEALLTRVNETDNKVKVLEERFQSLESKLLNQSNKCGLEMEDMMQEAEERYKRRKYLIVSGIPEASTGNIEERAQADVNCIKRMADHLQVQDFDEPTECSRIGKIDSAKPRLLRFKCQTMETKKEFLKKAKKLRSSNDYQHVYINADATYFQRKRGRELRAEMKRRREAGEKVMIRRGHIIKESDLKNFQ